MSGREREIGELKYTIISLTNEVKSIEALNESLQKLITGHNNDPPDQNRQECSSHNSSYNLNVKSNSVSAQFKNRKNGKTRHAQTAVTNTLFEYRTTPQHYTHPVNQNNDQRITQRGKSIPTERVKNQFGHQETQIMFLLLKRKIQFRCALRLRNPNMASNVNQRRNTEGFRKHTQ